MQLQTRHDILSTEVLLQAKVWREGKVWGQRMLIAPADEGFVLEIVDLHSNDERCSTDNRRLDALRLVDLFYTSTLYSFS